MPGVDIDMLEFLLNHVTRQAQAAHPSGKEASWSEADIAFLRQHHADMFDQEIAAALGRSENAVKIFRTRLCLPAASRARTAWVTSNEAAKMLGVDSHAMSTWCDAGLIPHTMSGPNRLIRMIRIQNLKAWAANPLNWPYFDQRRVTDPALRRLIALRALRWGDEWWTTKQVAAYHGVDVKDVTRLIVTQKTLTGYCPPVSKDGRHENRRWAYWFVRKSVAITAHFVRRGDDMARFTPRGDAWILKARNEHGMTWESIGRSMGNPKKDKPGKSAETIRIRYKRLIEREGGKHGSR